MKRIISVMTAVAAAVTVIVTAAVFIPESAVPGRYVKAQVSTLRKADNRESLLQEEDRQESDEPKESELYAKAAVLMDADSGRILYEKNGSLPMAMASTTKIMTCILALENADIREEAIVSGYASGMPKVKLSVKKGESYRLKDLLYSMMLESHNDSAAVIAEHIGKKILEKEKSSEAEEAGTEENEKKEEREDEQAESKKAIAAFAGLMNRKAAELGCKNTWFITPNGLDAGQTVRSRNGEEKVREHATTAAELAQIMSYCVLKSPKKEEFLTITGTPAYTFTANGRTFSCVNHNAFLSMMKGALSGKTGFTNKAGYCYVGALQNDGRTFTVALLDCGWPNHRNYKWSDTRKLMGYGLSHYKDRSLETEELPEGLLDPIPVENAQAKGLTETVYARIEKGEEKQGRDHLLMREDEKTEIEWSVEKRLTAPVEAGQIVGTVCYKVNGTVYLTEYLKTTQAIPARDFKWCLRQILVRFMLG